MCPLIDLHSTLVKLPCPLVVCWSSLVHLWSALKKMWSKMVYLCSTKEKIWSSMVYWWSTLEIMWSTMVVLTGTKVNWQRPKVDCGATLKGCVLGDFWGPRIKRLTTDPPVGGLVDPFLFFVDLLSFSWTPFAFLWTFFCVQVQPVGGHVIKASPSRSHHEASC
jgi:hypothetical protein